MSTVTQKAYQWLDARLSISAWQAMAEKKTVPHHEFSVWYYMGGIALVLLMVQVATGGLLMVYYIPEIASAHASILKINTQIDFGWFIRSLHSWGANLMILGLFFHLFSTYFMKAYRAPREITWLTGLGLLVLCFAFGFTGYLLPWDEMAFFATKVGIDITSKTPIIGEYMATLFRGGPEVSQVTLSRFFVIHVFVLPASLLGLLGIHLLLVQLHGMSEPKVFRERPKEQQSVEKFFPTFVLKDLMIWMLVLNVLAAAATLAPWGLGPEADPFAPAPAGIKPEWYFLAMFQILKMIPAYVGPIEGEHVGMLLFGLVGALFAAIPFLDRHGEGKNHHLISEAAKWFGIVVLAGFIIFTIWGMLE
ncbi:MAG: cytochrome bc complex cytochrome b subunit [Vampirovibrio sp.]|nr:cytochrome bc complex cytochrome b subunit [Vampirovibrio sp.]